MDKQQALDEARAHHQKNVDAIQRRGLHDRVVSRLQYWKTLELQGFALGNGDRDEIAGLIVDLETVRVNMAAAGQPPGDDVLMAALGSL